MITPQLTLDPHAHQPVDSPYRLDSLEAEAASLLQNQQPNSFGASIARVLRDYARGRNMSWQQLAMQLGPNHLFNVLLIKNKLGLAEAAATIDWWKQALRTLAPYMTGTQMCDLVQAMLDLRRAVAIQATR